MSSTVTNLSDFWNDVVNWLSMGIMIFVVCYSFYLQGKGETGKIRRRRQKLLSIYRKYHIADLEEKEKDEHWTSAARLNSS